MATDDTSKVSAPQGDGGATPSSPPPESPKPADDWQSRYTALEREYQQIKPQYEKYKAYGEPEIVGRAYDQLRQIAADFQAGKISYAQAQQAKAEVQQRDEFEGWEDLEPRKQAERMRDLLRNDVGGLTKRELDAFREEMKNYQVNLGTQQQLLFRIIDLKSQHPDLDINELIRGATEASGYGPTQILEMQAKALQSPKEVQRQIDAAVEAAKAKWQQEQDQKRVPPTTRALPRLAATQKTDPATRRQERITNLLRRSDELQTRRGA